MLEMSWPKLQRAALDDVHPAWFAGWDAALVNEARQHALGRRLMALTLAQEAAPVLFGSLPAVIPHALSGSDWMLLPGDRLAELTLDLGVAAFAEAIRRCIERQPVVRLRRVLGNDRYTRVLASERGDAQHLPEMQTELESALVGDETLKAAIYQRGLAEWMAFAAPVHPAAIERLRLSAAPGLTLATETPWLTAQSIARRIALVSELHRESAND